MRKIIAVLTGFLPFAGTHSGDSATGQPASRANISAGLRLRLRLPTFDKFARALGANAPSHPPPAAAEITRIQDSDRTAMLASLVVEFDASPAAGMWR